MNTQPLIITLAKGGTLERQVPLDDIVIPDLWHLAEELDEQGLAGPRNQLLECWHLCGSLLRTLQDIQKDGWPPASKED